MHSLIKFHLVKMERSYSNTKNRKRKPQGQQFMPVLFVLLALSVLAAVFYISGISGNNKNGSSASADPADTRKLLSAMEERPVPDPDSFRIIEEETEEETQLTENDIYSIQTQLLEHFGDYDYNSENFRYWFEDAAIVGDSMAEAILGFDWLYSQNLQTEVGINLQTCDEVIEGTVWLQPGTIFLTFSANNIATYGVGKETYIDDYTAIIRELQERVPGARIFVEAILPCDPDFAQEYWYYDYLDDYNYAMQQMCEELGVNYFDPGFILYAHPEIYREDGLHPSWEFYPLWLTYMAEISGLAD